MNRFIVQVAQVALVALSALIGLSSSAERSVAKPLTEAFVFLDTDWTSAAVGGIGGGNRHGGTGTIALSGVNGSVKQAILYWHGIDNFTPRPAGGQPDAGAWAGGRRKGAAPRPAHTASCDGFYDVSTIFFNGNAVTGVPLGDSETNCWGDGSSGAFRADVTAFVRGDGLYTLERMVADECDDVNGASLIVMFNDDNPVNNRDLVFCEGNDSNVAFGFPGETDGWHATLPGITYTSGTTAIQLHVADGQDFSGNGLDDDAVTIAADGQSVVIPDLDGRYEGVSVPSAGFSRFEALGQRGSLWDVHTFDISSVFMLPGVYTVTLDGQEQLSDCTGLVLAIIDLRAGIAQVSIQDSKWGRVKAMYR
jgi:hypothetical protein